jgi:hypothetical protein
VAVRGDVAQLPAERGDTRGARVGGVTVERDHIIR